MSYQYMVHTIGKFETFYKIGICREKNWSMFARYLNIGNMSDMWGWVLGMIGTLSAVLLLKALWILVKSSKKALLWFKRHLKNPDKILSLEV